MKTRRVLAMTVHTWYHLTHSLETWVDLFLNSAIQMLVFSFIAVAMNSSGERSIGTAMITGMLFWNIIWVAQYSICLGALWEIWSKSLSTMFVTPLTLGEFLVSQMVAGVFKASTAYVLTGMVAWIIFGFSFMDFGLMTIPYVITLLVFGWGIGMLVLSLIFMKGTDVQALSWFLVFLIQPFGGIFHSPDVLPSFIRPVSSILATTYVFEAIRFQIENGTVLWDNIAISALLAVGTFITGYVTLVRSYAVSLRNGYLARMLT